MHRARGTPPSTQEQLVLSRRYDVLEMKNEVELMSPLGIGMHAALACVIDDVHAALAHFRVHVLLSSIMTVQ